MKTTHTLKAAALGCALISMTASAGEDLLVTGASGLIQTVDLNAGSIGVLPTATETVISTAVHDGVLFMGNTTNEIVVFDLSTYTISNRFEIPQNATAIAWDGFNLAAGTTSGAVYYINHETGEIVDTIEQVGTDVTAIGVDAGGLYVGGQSTLAMRTHIGQSNFQFFAACGSLINSMAFGPTKMYLGGTTLFGDDSGTIYKFNKFVGGVNYSGTFEVPNDASATLEFNGLLYVGGSDGTLLEMDPDAGTILRTFDVGTAIHAVTPVNGISACPADYDASGELDIFDVMTFLELFNSTLPGADTTGDGIHDIFDVTKFVELFISGC